MCPNIAVIGSGHLGTTHAVGMAELGFDVIAIGAPDSPRSSSSGTRSSSAWLAHRRADGIDMLHGDGQAFPSGHTANATFTWIILVVVWLGPRGLHPDPARFGRWLTIAGAWVLVTSGLMVLLDYHWISDIPGGWALGALAMSVAVAVLNAPPTRVADPGQHEC